MNFSHHMKTEDYNNLYSQSGKLVWVTMSLSWGFCCYLCLFSSASFDHFLNFLNFLNFESDWTCRFCKSQAFNFLKSFEMRHLSLAVIVVILFYFNCCSHLSRWWRSCYLSAGHWGRTQPKALLMQPCWRWPVFLWVTWYVSFFSR